jgi:hypothetical protein
VRFSLQGRPGAYVRLPLARGARRVRVQVRTAGRPTDRHTLRVRRTAAPRCPQVPWARVLDRRRGRVVFATPAQDGSGRTRIATCRAPGGRAVRLFTADDEDDETGGDDVTRARAGARSVALVIRSSSRTSGSSLRLVLHDAATGRELAAEYVGSAEAFDPYPPLTEVHDLLVSRGGAAVAVTQFGRDVAVRALLPTGERLILDERGADPGSLRVHGEAVTWRHAGEARRATLPGD